MAKYLVKHICGHTVEHQLFGKLDERYRYLDYLATKVCDDCYRANRDAAADIAKTKRGLPDLTGTPKQIAWANTIREGAYKALDCLDTFADDDKLNTLMQDFDNLTDKVKAQWFDGASKIRPLCARWRSKMDAKTDAKWWLDNRFCLPSARPDAKSRDMRIACAARNALIGDFKLLFDANEEERPEG